MSTYQAKFAVAVLVLRMNDQIEGGWECVLVARKDDHSRWSLPGGKLDPPSEHLVYGVDGVTGSTLFRSAETPRGAAARELDEETGIRCDPRQLVELETVLDSGGYLTTFYILAANAPLPDEFAVAEHEAPVRWGSVYELLEGPYGQENAERLQKIGIFK